jgi:MFS family permease
MTDAVQPMSFGALSKEGNAVTERGNKWLFWACWVAMVATAFGFVVRAQVMDTWGAQFNLTKTQQGEIFGVGLWPFAISIILFSLVIDKIGYGTAMVFAFVCHVASAVITIWAPKHFSPYWSLYIGNFIVALANGTVEAVANPVVATLFSKQKTKWLNILHAGWPGGLVLGGLLALSMGHTAWEYKVGLLLIPTFIYGFMMLFAKFPVSERVAAGVPYHEMLKEFGFLGALIVSFMIFAEVGRDFNWDPWVIGGTIVVVTLAFGAYVRFSPGRPLFIFMLLIMVPLATTELGTDSWITSLMNPAMEKIGLAGVLVLVYTSFIMMVLRFSAGAIVHRISPLGLLACAAFVAGIGLLLLSRAEAALAILAAATVYGFGKTFFWPTMLGVVAEQSPKGGALTLNATGGVGMLGVGVVGAVFLGFIQDHSVATHLREQNPAVFAQVSDTKTWVFGKYVAVDADKTTSLVPLASDPGAIEADTQKQLTDQLKREPTTAEVKAALDANPAYAFALKRAAIKAEVAKSEQSSLGHEPNDEELAKALESNTAYQALLATEPDYKAQKETAATIGGIEEGAKKSALATVAIFPGIMLVCYLILILYFRAKGGYSAQVLTGHAAEDGKFTGGIEGPADA